MTFHAITNCPELTHEECLNQISLVMCDEKLFGTFNRSSASVIDDKKGLSFQNSASFLTSLQSSSPLEGTIDVVYDAIKNNPTNNPLTIKNVFCMCLRKKETQQCDATSQS